MNKINLQLYSFGMDSGLTPLQKIQTAADIGFTGVEFAGDYRGIPVGDVKKALTDAGLTAESAHVGLDQMEEEIPYLAELGTKLVICAMAQFNTAEEAKVIAERLNTYGKMAEKYGIKTGYHNHTDEFYVDNGKYLMDWLIEYSDPAYTMFEIDCGWASAAGIDNVEYINAHKGRIGAIHIKENSKVIGAEKPLGINDPSPWEKFKRDENGNIVIPEEFKRLMEERDKLNVATGSGIVDWKAVKAAADAQCDNVVYVVEREANYGGMDRISCIKEDIAWLKANL